MSRRAPRSRNVLRIARFLTVLVAVTAVVVGTVAPVEVAMASASQSTSTSLSRTSVDSAQLNVVKTSLAGFTPGNIISDAVFTNKNTMTEAQIQSFFNGKVSKCRAGYTCLKDFKITSVTRPADAYCKGYKGASNESAARIIYRVAQACNINPQVLIVMLQKEQGLVNHTWPSQWRYDIALGQGCPDTAACDPKYVGFFHQIYGAARQMQTYMEGRYFTWYAPGKTWNLRYHPNASCGSSPVYISNKATSALYYYTPYQPNAAAIAAGYGEAKNACSSYGNRNFYNYFTDWFGSTQTGKPTTPPAPTTPKPPTTLPAMNTASFATAVDGSGTLWGYPFTKGQWGDRVKMAVGLGATSSVMMPGDLDGDGNRDAVLRLGNNALLMRGNGKTFNSAQSMNADWRNVVLTTAAGDVDGDGVPDILTTNKAGALALWRGDNKGGLRPGVQIGVGWTGMNSLVGGIDMNRDGNPDVVARDTAGRLWVYYGNGRSGWIRQQQLGHGWGGMSAVFTPGDFTGDGVSDLMGRTKNGDLWLYPGDGAGSITSSGKIGYGWQIMKTISGAGPAVKGPRVLPPGAGDVDRDGESDVLALSTKGTLNLYRGNGAASWRGSQQIASGWSAKDRMLTMGDFNGDGYRDLGRIDPQGKFMLYPGQAAGGYGKAITIGNGWQALSLLVGGIDYDGDRNTDVIGRDGAGRLVLYRGNGKGGWASSATPIGQGWGGFNHAVNAGDFDGDGRADLLLRRTDSSLWLYPTTGKGSWGTPRQIGVGWGGFTSIISPGDFDGNGTSDVLARTSGGDLYLFRGNGRGGWGASGIIGWGWASFAALG